MQGTHELGDECAPRPGFVGHSRDQLNHAKSIYRAGMIRGSGRGVGHQGSDFDRRLQIFGPFAAASIGVSCSRPVSDLQTSVPGDTVKTGSCCGAAEHLT
jgi:hypothetical protein